MLQFVGLLASQNFVVLGQIRHLENGYGMLTEDAYWSKHPVLSNLAAAHVHVIFPNFKIPRYFYLTFKRGACMAQKRNYEM